MEGSNSRYASAYPAAYPVAPPMLRGSVVERRCLTGELSLSCARPDLGEWMDGPAADG